MANDFAYCGVAMTAHQRNKSAELEDAKNEEDTVSDIVSDYDKVQSSITEAKVEPQFPDLINTYESRVGFPKTDQGSLLPEKWWIGLGRFCRLFVNIERYDNAWENSVQYLYFKPSRWQQGDPVLLEKHGPEWALGYIVLRLGGAFKLQTDDRWIENARLIRTQTKKDFTLEAIDLRGSIINEVGMSKFQNVGYVRYLNFADCQLFNNLCMTKLHPVADTLEFLDISGTKVTPEGLSYLRIFPRLKWLNISRLSNPERMRKLLPYLLEILPDGCVVLVDDERHSFCYGSDIPFRHLTNPIKDHLIEGADAIGDVTLFKEAYGELQLQDITSVYELWKTPKISKQRSSQMNAVQVKLPRIGKLAQYIRKAEKYPPLLWH